LYLLLPFTSGADQQRKLVTTRSETLKIAPTPQPSPPAVDFQAFTARESVERGEELTVFLFIANKSALPLTELKFIFQGNDFGLVKNPSFHSPLAPFGSVMETAIIKAKDTADYASHKLLLLVEYDWNSNGPKYRSAQPATATVLVMRRFDEETKGFPGGTAAFFYLLLPIIPAILSYQFLNRLRKGEGAHLPTFSAEYIVPAFFIAVFLSLLMLSLFRWDARLNYSNPLVFIGTLFGSLFFGAIVPGLRIIYELIQNRVWGFDNNDTPATYLRKALLAPSAPREFKWATGKVGEQSWEGILLRQPNGAIVLGAKLQVSYTQDVFEDDWRRFLREVIAQDGRVINRQLLVKMVESGELNLDVMRRIICDGGNVQQIVVIEEVKNWKRVGDEASPLINPSR
jgi:hypothetical protein